MITKTKYRMLIWLVVILLATNLSMVLSFVYHRNEEKTQEKVIAVQPGEEQIIEVPAQQRTRFFREQLNLHPAQMEKFRELNRNFNRTAWQINRELDVLRINMVRELGKENPNDEELEAISENIGRLHTELKNVTIEYYLDMKKVCNEQQQERLNAIFMSILRDDEGFNPPRRGRRHGRNNW